MHYSLISMNIHYVLSTNYVVVIVNKRVQHRSKLNYRIKNEKDTVIDIVIVCFLKKRCILLVALIDSV